MPAATRVVQKHNKMPLCIEESSPPVQVELLEPRNPNPPVCLRLKEIDRFVVSGIAPEVTKDDLWAYFAKIENIEVESVHVCLQPGVAIVAFDDSPSTCPGNNYISACESYIGV